MSAVPASNLGFECVKPLVPERAVPAGERVELVENPRTEAVDARGPRGARLDDVALAQETQVSRDGGLADLELVLDDAGEFARSHVAGREQFGEPPTHRVAQQVQRAHNSRL